MSYQAASDIQRLVKKNFMSFLFLLMFLLILLQKLALCRCLYKLLFQLVLLFESYLKLLDAFQMVTASPQVSFFKCVGSCTHRSFPCIRPHSDYLNEEIYFAFCCPTKFKSLTKIKGEGSCLHYFS